jgi:hypothetical protein
MMITADSTRAQDGLLAGADFFGTLCVRNG